MGAELFAFVKGVTMSLSRIARAVSGGVYLSTIPLVAAAALLGGCAKQPDGNTTFVWPGSQPMQVAAAPPPRAPDLEDDGREAQLPPLVKRQPQPDDPREPWSPNYGSLPPAKGRTAAAIPDDLPPAFRRRLADAVQE